MARRKKTFMERCAKEVRARAKDLHAAAKRLSHAKEPRIILGVVTLLGLGLPVFFILRHPPNPIVIRDVELPAVAVPFTMLTKGEASPVGRRVNYVIKSHAQLQELWTQVLQEKGKLPAIDFKTHAVLAVFAGTEPVANIKVAKIEDSDKRMVSIIIEQADKDCAKVQTDSPYELVTVPVSALPIAHEDITSEKPCP